VTSTGGRLFSKAKAKIFKILIMNVQVRNLGEEKIQIWKLKIMRNECCSFVSACFLALICVSGPKTGLKCNPETLPATSEILQITHVSRPRCPRVRVTQHFSYHVCASSTHSCRSCSFQSVRSRQARECVTLISSISCGRVNHATTWLLAGHLLNSLCSFHFCTLPLHSLRYSCPMKPETLNTHITASNGTKEDKIYN